MALVHWLIFITIMANTRFRKTHLTGGYFSTVQDIAHFGVGTTTNIDSIIIRWPNFKKQILKNVKADQTLNVNIKNAYDAL